MSFLRGSSLAILECVAESISASCHIYPGQTLGRPYLFCWQRPRPPSRVLIGQQFSCLHSWEYSLAAPSIYELSLQDSMNVIYGMSMRLSILVIRNQICSRAALVPV